MDHRWVWAIEYICNNGNGSANGRHEKQIVASTSYFVSHYENVWGTRFICIIFERNVLWQHFKGKSGLRIRVYVYIPRFRLTPSHSNPLPLIRLSSRHPYRTTTPHIWLLSTWSELISEFLQFFLLDIESHFSFFLLAYLLPFQELFFLPLQLDWKISFCPVTDLSYWVYGQKYWSWVNENAKLLRFMDLLSNFADWKWKFYDVIRLNCKSQISLWCVSTRSDCTISHAFCGNAWYRCI